MLVDDVLKLLFGGKVLFKIAFAYILGFMIYWRVLD